MLRLPCVVLVAPLVVLTGAAPCAIADAQPRRGKAVRVERIARRFAGTPRLCSFAPEELRGYCFGAQPEVGDAIAVVDLTHVVGTTRLTRVEPIHTCKTRPSMVWMIEAEAASGLTSTADSVALIDVPTDPRRTHLVTVDTPPIGRASTATIVGIDTDGVNRADLEFVVVPCDDPSSQGSATSTECVETWAARDGRELELLRTDLIPTACS